ncbi:4Fe-4S binding protein [Sulfuricurvum sp.]|uniref:4Fe-4S binding protein n=1 Tax=Sulfuricurvum sp. TaxID=2025608 RepID=UPI00199385D2|nr:4Fe-4S binding protein [Sulfuricurvum sp.]MBD3798796.1 4Fe-4S binding protein [Campylobacterota bacterium]MBD3806518.1 4Fe-4S binding protein [Sulfuricurvum sp.]
MANINFIQTSNLFSYTATRCLRNEYYHNDCRICIDLCPKGAFNIVRNKLTLFEDECVGCAGCIGSCPSEALEIESFDPNGFAAGFIHQSDKKLSCKVTTPCLGVFDVEHLAVMALRGGSSIVCDMSHCSSCVLNENGALERSIRTKIETTNQFLESIHNTNRIEMIEEKEEQVDRRALFRKGFEKLKESVVNESEAHISMTSAHHKQADMKMPLKRILLKNSLKEIVGDLETTTFLTTSSLFFNKQINFTTCTNCGDCTQFCPTDALFPTSDKQGIYFSQGKCIGCGICEDICKPNAINAKEGYDLINIAFDRAEELVHYEMVMCYECRTPYPYKGGEPICDRCIGFVKQNPNMFTLARDL